MPALGDLLARLRAGGELDSRGRFTLDREKAREKLRRHRLAEPRHFVLELVQGAVLGGATHVAFDIDADDVHARFDGRPFALAGVDELYDSLFVRGDAPELRARRHLALGLEAAMALRPRHVRVRSGEIELILAPGQPDRLRRSTRRVDGTHVHVKARLRPGTLVQVVQEVRGKLVEEVCLRERCAFTEIPVTVDGELVSGRDRSPGALRRRVIDAPGMRGEVALYPGQISQLRLLVDGVWIATHPLAAAPMDCLVTVQGARLREDLSTADVVRDEGYEEVLREVLRARAQLLGELAAELARGEATGAPGEWARRVLLDELLRTTSASRLRQGPWAELAALPVLRDARGEGEPVCLRQLLRARDERGVVPWSGAAVPGEAPDRDLPVVLLEGEEGERMRALLRRLFGGALREAPGGGHTGKGAALRLRRQAHAGEGGHRPRPGAGQDGGAASSSARDEAATSDRRDDPATRDHRDDAATRKRRDDVATRDRRDEAATRDRRDDAATSDRRDEAATSDRRDGPASSDRRDDAATSDRRDEAATTSASDGRRAWPSTPRPHHAAGPGSGSPRPPRVPSTPPDSAGEEQPRDARARLVHALEQGLEELGRVRTVLAGATPAWTPPRLVLDEVEAGFVPDRIASPAGSRVLLHLRHPLVAAALARPDPALVILLATAVCSARGRGRTDADRQAERFVLRAAAEVMLARCGP